MFKNVLPRRREARANAVFQETLRQIIHGKTFFEKCLSGTTYKYYKCWAKAQPEFQHLVNGTKEQQKEFNKFCAEVTEAAYCFDNWEKIVHHLTDKRIDSVDARNFSVRYYYCAGSWDWCLGYNEKLRRKQKKQPGNELPYTEEKFREIFEHIVQSGILQDIEYNQKLAAGIGDRLQNAMTKYCRRQHQYQPY